MQRLLVTLLILVASVWIGAELARHPGYALFSYRQWVVEMPLWLAFIATVISFLLLHSFWRMARFIRNIDQHFGQWLRQRLSNKAHDKTHRGLLAIVEEHWSNAERHLLAGVSKAKHPALNYLSAAEAALAQKAYDRCETYLKKAHQAAPEAKVAIGLVQAKVQLEQGQLEQAQLTLVSLQQLSPYHPAVLKQLEKLYIRHRDWQSLLKLLPSLTKARALSSAQVEIFEKNLYAEILDEAARKNQSLHAVRELWKSMPKAIRLHPDILERYGKLLKGDKDSAEELEPLFRKRLNKEWNADLVKLYGQLHTSDPTYQLKLAEGWLKQYGNRAALLLTLGRLAKRCQLWGKARHYFEEELSMEKSSEAQFELAGLCEQLGEKSEALEHYKKGLALATGQD